MRLGPTPVSRATNRYSYLHVLASSPPHSIVRPKTQPENQTFHKQAAPAPSRPVLLCQPSGEDNQAQHSSTSPQFPDDDVADQQAPFQPRQARRRMSLSSWSLPQRHLRSRRNSR